MEQTVKIVLPRHRENQVDADVLHELHDVQSYFDKENIDLGDSELVFVPLKGIYRHITRKMTMVGVWINHSPHDVTAIQCRLKLHFRNTPARIAEVHLRLPVEFVGKLQPGEGLLLHVDIPVQGLKEDRIFEQSEITGELSDVELKYLKT
jgi:hypothetical protein